MRLTVAAIVLALISSTCIAAEPITGPARVTDGDTLYVGNTRVQPEGIDAPEKRHTCTRNGKPWRCWLASKQALELIIGSDQPRCVASYCDVHGRLVTICRVNGKDLGEEMVRQGWAIDWPQYSGRRYQAAEAEARVHRRGLWAEGVELPDLMKERRASKPGGFKRYECPR